MSQEAPNRKAERVLVVEDNEHAAYLLRTLLEHAGYAVSLSPDGRDALESSPRWSPWIS